MTTQPYDSDQVSEHYTSASGRLPNDPGPEATGGGVEDLLTENLAQQQRQPDESPLTDSEAEYNKRAGQVMSDESPAKPLADELRRAQAQLSPPPGESSATAEYARQAAILLACLRYSGVGENEIRSRLNMVDRAFVVEQAEHLSGSTATDAPEAVGLLQALLQRTDVEVEQVIAVASVGASDTY
jgi:hypothetical protein